MKKFPIRWPIFWVLVSYGTLFLVVLTGVLDALVPGGTFYKKSATVSIIIYAICTYVLTKTIQGVRKCPRTTALLGASLLVVLVLAELGIRLFHPAGAHLEFSLWYSPEYHHVTRPNAKMYHGVDADTGDPVFVQTDEHGYRTQYTVESFLEHDTRIIALGDSFTFGVFVDQPDAYPQALERILRQRQRRDGIAVLNTGTVSHSPFIERSRLERDLYRYRPTHVILLLDPTDIEDDYEYERISEQGKLGPFFPSTAVTASLGAPVTWADHSALCQRLLLPIKFIPAFILHPIALASSTVNPLAIHGVTIDGETVAKRYFIYRYPLEKTRPYFDNCYANIAAISEHCEQLGAKFLLVVSPRFHHWNPEECPWNWESTAYGRHEPHQFEYFKYFDEKKADAGFPILNLLPAFQESDQFPLCFTFDPHWNPTGNQLVASTIADHLLQTGLIRELTIDDCGI